MAAPLRTQIKLDGVAELAAALKEAPLDVAKKGLRKAVNAGISPIAKAYRRALPKGQTGLTRKVLSRKTRFKEKDARYYGVVGLDRKKGGTRTSSSGKVYPHKPGYIAHLWEGGVKPHRIVPKSGPYKNRKVQHPGLPARNALKGAVEGTAGQVRAAMEAKLREAIEEAWDKHAR